MSVGLLNTAIRLLGGYPLEVSERLLLVLLAWRADENGETHMNRAELGRQSGLSRPTIRKTLSRLEMMGLVSGKHLQVGVSALVRLSAGLEMENGLPSQDGQNGKQFAIFGESGMENGLPKNGKRFAVPEKGKMENSFPSGRQTVCQKMENGLPPYRQTNKDTLSACACAREGSPVSSEPAQAAGVGEVRAVSPASGRSEPVRVHGWEALRAFRGAYPKPPRDLQALNREWALLEHEGVDGRAVTLEELLGALAEAKLSKQWQEDGGRFVPRPEVWLGERQFVPLLLAAAERRASGKTQAEREAEEAARANEAAEATDWLADEEI